MVELHKKLWYNKFEEHGEILCAYLPAHYTLHIV